MTGDFIAYTIIGLLATGMMTTFLWIITGLGVFNVDMIRALGSLYTRDEKTSFVPGLMIHFTGGLFFAYSYITFFHFVPLMLDTSFIYVVLGTGMGFVHGMVVALALTVMVAEHHPIEKYREVGFGVAIFHFIPHVLYGFIIGLLYSWYSHPGLS